MRKGRWGNNRIQHRTSECHKQAFRPKTLPRAGMRRRDGHKEAWEGATMACFGCEKGQMPNLLHIAQIFFTLLPSFEINILSTPNKTQPFSRSKTVTSKLYFLSEIGRSNTLKGKVHNNQRYNKAWVVRIILHFLPSDTSMSACISAVT